MTTVAQSETIDLTHFHGSVEFLSHWTKVLVCTEGVWHLADEAGAHWLVDVIASHLATRKMAYAKARDSRLRDMQIWDLTLNKTGSGAKVTAIADSGEEPFITQRIPFTDFPIDRVITNQVCDIPRTLRLYLVHNGENWTLMLPGEY